MTDTYVADARFEDGQWQATVRGLRGAHTYARTVESLRKRLREVVVLMDDRAETDLHDEDAFQVSLAFDLHVTDVAGATDSVSVTVRPGPMETRAEVHGPRVTVIESEARDVEAPAATSAVKATPTATLELGAMKSRRTTSTAALELRAGASLTSGARTAGALQLNAGASLSGGGVLTAGAAPHEAVAYAALMRQRAEDAEREAEHATRMAVLIGLAGGMGMRDIAALMGISHQRVSQIAGAEGHAAAGRAGDGAPRAVGIKDRHVVKHDDGWAVVTEGSERASVVTRTQREAISRAREILHNAGGGELVVHGENGKIRSKDTVAPSDTGRSSKG